jgi:hypothetical protein
MYCKFSTKDKGKKVPHKVKFLEIKKLKNEEFIKPLRS